ncbi:MAG: CdvA-like protein [Thermoprotei archaeon]|nr:CdvA-like protein [Thermoprotei archaeon]
MESARPLNDMSFEELKKLIKLPVMDEEGRRIGVVDKIHVDAKKMIAKNAEIHFQNGKRKKVPASHLFYIGGAILYSKDGVLRTMPKVTVEMEPDLAKAKGIFDKVRVIRQRLMKLDELLMEGKITEATFKILRNDYENQLKTLEELGVRYVDRLKKRLVELEQSESELSEKLNIYEARLYVGEITELEYDKLTRGLRVELDKVRNQAKMIRDFLQDYAEKIPLMMHIRTEPERGEEQIPEPKAEERLQEETVPPAQKDEEEEVGLESMISNIKNYYTRLSESIGLSGDEESQSTE